MLKKRKIIPVLPDISTNCYSCHNSPLIKGGIRLDSYTNIKVLFINGNLVGAVTHVAG